MSLDPRYNVVTFTPDNGERVALKLNGPIKLSPGLRPDLFTAIVSYKEWEKLGEDDLGVDGSIELYFSASPEGGQADVKIEKVRLVDAEPGEQGTTPDDIQSSSDSGGGSGSVVPARVIEYTLTFADFRHRFVAPYGGRLEEGRLNLSRAKTRDPDLENVPAAWTMKDLIEKCVERMGLSISVPGTVDSYDAPQDIKWFGNHAPTELAKLLDACDHVFCPTLDGKGAIWKRGDGTTPVIPEGRALPQAAMKGLDRRGKAVVVASYPTQIVKTIDLEDIPDAFRYCFPDSEEDGAIRKLDLVPMFQNDPEGKLRDGFETIPEDKRAFARQAAYRMIQLDPDVWEPAMQPLYADVYTYEEEEGSDQKTVKIKPLALTAPVIVKDNVGAVKAITGDPIIVQADRENNVLSMSLRIGSLDGTKSDEEADFTEEDVSEITGKFSLGEAEWDDETGGSRPKYYKVGFKRIEGTITQMSDDELTAAELDGDTVFVIRPELLALSIDDEIVNKLDLEEKAKQIADQHLKDVTQVPTVMKCVGFLRGEPDGHTTTVVWDQSSLTTTFTVDDWHRPGGPMPTEAERRDLQEAEAYPMQRAIADDRSIRNEAGTGQPIVPVNAAPSAGGGIPKPTRRYQFYTPIDDSLRPIWTQARVQEV